MISAIVAMGPRRQIGKNNDLIYRTKTDMERFVRLTKGKTVIMGYNTWKSLPTPFLKDRKNIVIVDFKMGVPDDIKEASEKYEELDYQDKMAFFRNDIHKYVKSKRKEYFIIGGGELYKTTQKYWDRMYLSLFTLDLPGDTFFPFYRTSGWLIRENKIYPEYRYIFFERAKKRWFFLFIMI